MLICKRETDCSAVAGPTCGFVSTSPAKITKKTNKRCHLYIIYACEQISI